MAWAVATWVGWAAWAAWACNLAPCLTTYSVVGRDRSRSKNRTPLGASFAGFCHGGSALKKRPTDRALKQLSGSPHASTRIFVLHHDLGPLPQPSGVRTQHLLFDGQNLRRMHGETAQTQPQQQTGHLHISRHFAADTDALALRIALRDGVGHQTQDGGM